MMSGFHLVALLGRGTGQTRGGRRGGGGEGGGGADSDSKGVRKHTGVSHEGAQDMYVHTHIMRVHKTCTYSHHVEHILTKHVHAYVRAYLASCLNHALGVVLTPL